MRERAQQQLLIRCGINPLKLRAVFISHLHGDHVFGLFSADLDAGALRAQNPAAGIRPAPFGEILACTCGFSTANCPIRWSGPGWTRPSTRCCWKTARSKCGAFRCATGCRRRASSSARKNPPLNVEFKIAKYGLTVAQITAAKRGEEITLPTGGWCPTRADLPPLCAPVVRLPLGHQLLGEGRDAGQGRGPDVATGDLRRRRAENGQGAGPLDGRQAKSRPRPGQAADNRTLFVPLQEQNILVEEARAIFRRPIRPPKASPSP